jgi:uncharacterized membrane protein YgcG
LPNDIEGNEITDEEYNHRLAAREARWANREAPAPKSPNVEAPKNIAPPVAGASKKSFISATSEKLRGAREKLRDYNDKAFNSRIERRNKQIKELEQKTKIARLQSQTATYQRKANPPAYRPSTGIKSGIDLGSGFGGSFGGGMGGSGISFGGRGGGIDLGPMFGGGPALEPKKKHKKQNKKSKNNGQNIHIHIDRR